MILASYFKKNQYYPLFLLPAIVSIFVLSIVPILGMFLTSLLDWNLASILGWKFIGIGNFLSMLKDHRFIGSLKTQAIISVATVSLQVGLGLGAGLLLNGMKGRAKMLRTVVIFPFVLPPVVVALTWLTLFTPAISPINAIIEALGFRGPEWLAIGWLAILSIVIADTWSNFPFVTIIILAALQSIPEELYEAASIDGASDYQKVTRITLPMIRWAIVLCSILRLIESLKAFPLIFIMTGGGPGTATEVTNFYAYLQAFQYSQIGYASALAFIVFLITFLLSLLINKVNAPSAP